MNPRKFVLFLKKKKNWARLRSFFCLINCCREISYIVKVKIHVKWGRNRCWNRVFQSWLWRYEKPNFVNQLWRSLSCFFFMIKCPKIVRNNLKFKSPQDPDQKKHFFQLFAIQVATGSFDPYCRILDPMLEVEDDLQHMPHVPHVPHIPHSRVKCVRRV